MTQTSTRIVNAAAVGTAARLDDEQADELRTLLAAIHTDLRDAADCTRYVWQSDPVIALPRALEALTRALASLSMAIERLAQS